MLKSVYVYNPTENMNGNKILFVLVYFSVNKMTENVNVTTFSDVKCEWIYVQKMNTNGSRMNFLVLN